MPTSFNEAKIKLVEHFNWKRVAVLYDFSADAALYVKVCIQQIDSILPSVVQ